MAATADELRALQAQYDSLCERLDCVTEGVQLLRLAQATQEAIASPLAFARLVRANLMHRRRLDRLLETQPPTLFNPAQQALQWTPS